MTVANLGEATVNMVVDTAGFEEGMARAERVTKRAAKEIKYQGEQLKNLKGQIDPAVGALNRLDAQQQKLEAHFKAGRLPEAEYTAYTSKLNESRKALELTNTALGNNAKQLNAGAMSAKATAAALRGVPAQFTDIAVSLQAGQAPLTVLLQQGGQLKDMFGGIGPAAKALGGYVLGLVNPFTVAASAAAALALAYKQGSDETTAFTAALALSGNTAGTTSGQLADLAQQVSLTGGTVGKASAVLAQLAASTRIPKEAFEQIAVAAIAFEKATGVAAEETVKNFEKIAKDPTAEILKLNETLNFLTATTYEHIKSLQEQGKIQEAAQVANEAYEQGLERVATSVKSNLGTLETSWNAVKSAAKGAWDAALNIGREQTLDQKIKSLDDKLKEIANVGSTPIVFSDNPDLGAIAGGADALQAEKTQLLIQKAEEDRRAAAKGFQQQAQQQALADQLEIDKLRKETESNADKRAKETANYRLLVERRVQEARKTGDNSLLISAAEQARQIAAINEKYKDPKVAKTPAVREDAGQKLLGTLREQAAALQMQSDSIDDQTGKYKTLGVQAKALAEFEQRIANIKETKVQTADQKSILASEDLLRAQLKRNVALEQEIAARKSAYEETAKLAAFEENQQSKLAQAQDGLNSQLTGLGQGEKLRERLKEDLAIRKDYQSEVDKLNKQLNTGQISEDLYQKETDILEENLASRLVIQQDYYNQLDEAQGSFFLGASEGWANWADEASNYSAQAAEFVKGSLDTLSDGLADTFMSILDGTKSVGDAFADLGAILVKEIVGALIKMAAQWIVYQGVILLTGKATQASASVALIANAQATAFQASLAAFASTAAIPIVGPILAPAAAASAAAFAAPLVAGVATASLAGMAHDGIDSIPETGTWLLQKGERVTTASTSAKLDKTLESVQQNRTDTRGGQTVNIIEDASKAGQTRTRLDEQGMREITDVFVSQIYGDGELGQAVQGRFGLRGVGQ